MISLSPISIEKARAYFAEHSAYRGEFNIAIAAADEKGLHGVIALVADGDKFSLGHVSTDGNAQVGSLLYGGAWRTAKAMGYACVWI